MPETLTESFCERCGTRYTFEAAAPKGKRLGKIKVLSKGFVNFVSNDDRSLDEAFAEARSDEQRELTSQQLDAFHQTFQFCMSCRQYTCANCWNDVESRCLSCAPLGNDSLVGSFPAVNDPLARIGFGQPAPDVLATNGHQNGVAELPALGEPATAADSAWPTTDRPTDVGPADLVWPELPALPAVAGDSELPAAEAAVVAAAPEALAEEPVDEDVALAVAEAERMRQAAAEAEAKQATLAVVAAEAERLRLAAEAEAELDRQRQAAAALESERVRQAAEAQAKHELEVAAEAERQRLAAEADAEAERQRIAADAEAAQNLEAATAADSEAQRERQAAVEAEALRQRLAVEAELTREREAAAEAERQRQADVLAAAAAPSQDDRVETPTWAIVAPETQTTPEPGPLDVPPTVLAPQPPLPTRPSATNGAAQATNGAAGAVNGAPQPPAGGPDWPSPATTPPPQWPMPQAVAPQWPVGQGTARGANDDLWAASSQDVLSKAGQGVQACTSCGLPLSASARFCRRCGTQQQ